MDNSLPDIEQNEPSGEATTDDQQNTVNQHDLSSCDDNRHSTPTDGDNTSQSSLQQVVVMDSSAPTQQQPLEVEDPTSASKKATCLEDLKAFGTYYINKLFGVPGKQSPPMNPFLHILLSSVLGFIGILLVSITDQWYLISTFDVDNHGIKMLSGAYAATAGMNDSYSLLWLVPDTSPSLSSICQCWYMMLINPHSLNHVM